MYGNTAASGNHFHQGTAETGSRSSAPVASSAIRSYDSPGFLGEWFVLQKDGVRSGRGFYKASFEPCKATAKSLRSNYRTNHTSRKMNATVKATSEVQTTVGIELTRGNASDNTSAVLRFEDYPRPVLTGGFVALVIMAFLGVISNAVSIAALLRSSKLLRNATTALVINLCFTDLLFSALSTPLAATVFWHAGWVYSDGLCVAYGVSRFFNTGASIFTVMAISINRYVAIVKPGLYARAFTEGNNLLAVTATWLLTLSFLFWPTAGVWGQLGWDGEIGVCTVLPKNGRSSKTFLFVTAYFVPATSLVICYSRIYWIVRKTQRNMRQYSSNHKSAAFVALFFAQRQDGVVAVSAKKVQRQDGVVAVSAKKVQRQQRRIAKEWRVLKTVFVIFAVFTLCYLPVAVLQVFRFLDDYPGFQVFVYLTYHFSGCVNPLIYICMSREYRQAYKELLPCAMCAACPRACEAKRLPCDDDPF